MIPGLGTYALEEGMATHSSILAWRIPWTEEPGGLQSTGSQKSRTRLSDSAQHSHNKADQHGEVWNQAGLKAGRILNSMLKQPKLP